MGCSDEAPLYLPTRVVSLEAGGEPEPSPLYKSNGVPFPAHMGCQRRPNEELGLLPQPRKVSEEIMSKNSQTGKRHKHIE